MTPMFWFGVAYWFISMGFFIWIKGKSGDEVSTFLALFIAALWPVSVVLVISFLVLEHFVEWRSK